MRNTSELSKVAELRAKTDQLVSIIGNELDLGLRVALIAEAGSASDGESAESARLRAETIYDESLILLRAVDDLGERRRLERKLTHLRDALGRRSAPHDVRVQPAYS